MLVLASAAFAPSLRLRAPPNAHAALSPHAPARAAARACVGALDELEGPFWDEFREFAGEEADEYWARARAALEKAVSNRKGGKRGKGKNYRGGKR